MKSPKISLPSFQKPNIDGRERAAGAALALALCAPLPRPAAAFKVSAAGADWRVSVSPARVICQYIVMTALNIISLISLILDFLEEPSKRVRAGETALASFIWICDLACAMVLGSLVIYSEPIRGKRLFRVLRQMQQVNAKLKNDPSTKTERVKITAIACILVWSIVFHALDTYQIVTTLDNDDGWLILMIYCPYSMANVLGLLAALQWGFTVLAVRSAAAALNRQLQQLRYGSEYNASLSQLQATIRYLAQSHEQIGCVVKQLNATDDGAIILVTLMVSSLRLASSPYYSILGSQSGLEILWLMVLSLSWPMLHFLTLLVIVEPCHLTQKQRETTKFLLSQLMVHLAPRCRRLSEELDRFVTQIRLTDAKFMPLGVYVLARPLIATILGGVITYLIIILQFMSFTKNNT